MPREVPNLGFLKLGRKGNGGWEAKKWKVEEHTDLGLPLLFESSEWEREMKSLYCDSQDRGQNLPNSIFLVKF